MVMVINMKKSRYGNHYLNYNSSNDDDDDDEYGNHHLNYLLQKKKELFRNSKKTHLPSTC